MACRMIVEAAGAGIALNRLPKTLEHDFLARSGYRPRRTWQS